MTAIGFVHDAADTVEVDQRMHGLGLGAAQLVEIDLEVTRLGGLHAQLVFTILALRKIQRTRLGDAAALPGFALELFVELHRVVLQPGDIVVVMQAVDAGCRVPGRARGQFVAFEQHDVGPAELGQVIQDRRADQAAADDYCLCMRFHLIDSPLMALDSRVPG